MLETLLHSIQASIIDVRCIMFSFAGYCAGNTSKVRLFRALESYNVNDVNNNNRYNNNTSKHIINLNLDLRGRHSIIVPFSDPLIPILVKQE